MPGSWRATVPERPWIVVAAASARYLAASAARAGYRVAAADWFGDEDTRAAADAVAVADGRRPSGLVAAAGTLRRVGLVRPPLVWGAGFEGGQDLLRRLRHSFDLWGNSPFVTELLAQPRRLFQLLDALEVPHPEVRLEGDAVPADWLLKHAASSGGAEVYDAGARPGRRADSYWQRRVDGQTFSAVFAADGQESRIIGFNRLLSSAVGERPFVYGGAVSGFDPGPRQRAAVALYAGRLTRALGLRGVNGLDLVLEDGRPLVLELNARPPATLELYEEALRDGGLAVHLAACSGHLEDSGTATPAGIRGCRVLYATRDLVVPVLQWPDWAKDRPAAGTPVGAGEPLCTVHAGGASAVAVEGLLARRAAEMAERLGGDTGRAAA